MIHSTVALEPEDIAILYKGVKKPNAALIIFIAVLLAAVFWGSREMDTWIPFIACLVFALIVPGWYFLQKSTAQAFTKSGTKSIYKGTLDKKILKIEQVEGCGDDFPGENRYYYYNMGGRDFTVSPEFYDNFKEGDSITIHATIPSDIVFKITAG